MQTATKKAIGSHHSAKAGKDEWLTPPEIIQALGTFDLDPCSPITRPWPTAAHHLTILDDGLFQPWKGRVWCNPPYGQETGKWLARCALHRNATALVFARTETAAWREHVWPKAHSILFLHGRLHFHHVDGSRALMNSGGPSALISYDPFNTYHLASSKIPGHLVKL
jgi:hypothetical protein